MTLNKIETQNKTVLSISQNSKGSGISARAFAISYEGGDSEFINYLIHTILTKYVQNMTKS